MGKIQEKKKKKILKKTQHYSTDSFLLRTTNRVILKTFPKRNAVPDTYMNKQSFTPHRHQLTVKMKVTSYGPDVQTEVQEQKKNHINHLRIADP